jgi:hypothetical protein
LLLLLLAVKRVFSLFRRGTPLTSCAKRPSTATVPQHWVIQRRMLATATTTTFYFPFH